MTAAKARILLLDDDASFLQMVSKRLSTQGYRVEAHTDSAKAIELIRQGKIDIAFVDFKMPELSGIEFVSRIREFNPTIPLMLLTGHADRAFLEKYKHLNIHGVFAKLDDFKKLGDLIEAVLRGVDRSVGKQA